MTRHLVVPTLAAHTAENQPLGQFRAASCESWVNLVRGENPKGTARSAIAAPATTAWPTRWATASGRSPGTCRQAVRPGNASSRSWGRRTRGYCGSRSMPTAKHWRRSSPAFPTCRGGSAGAVSGRWHIGINSKLASCQLVCYSASKIQTLALLARKGGTGKTTTPSTWLSLRCRPWPACAAARH